ncbi:MAG: GAF domain-containing protein [Flavobacteriaceae bacterium]
MKIIPSNYKKNTDLPLKLKISFEAIFEYLEQISKDKNHILYSTSKELLEEYKQYPILREGFDDFSNLSTYNKEISRFLDVLFPELLQTNEIKAASIPFEFTTFKLSKRFEKILDEAGSDYELKLKNFDESNIYLMTCTFILAFHYNVHLDLKRPFYFDIPNKKTGFTRHYRALYNGDFFKVKPLDHAPKITDDDVKLLINNFDNIDLWREKFPPNSYEFKGFGMINLVDITSDYLISNLKESLIRNDQDAKDKVEQSISNLFESNDIKFEFSGFTTLDNKITYKYVSKRKSYIVQSKENIICEGYFCNGVLEKLFTKKEVLAISDVEEYGVATNQNEFYKTLNSQGIQSIILVPLELSENFCGVMELVSPNKFELNSINANKLQDVIPIFKIAAKRYLEELNNKIESVIQEHYTSIHPTVKWKFTDAAEKYINQIESNDKASSKLNDIVFENVVPLYGQSDIKGSTIARNKSIQLDLEKQLNLALHIIDKAKSLFKLPIYDDLFFRIDNYRKDIKKGLHSGDETSIAYFLKKEIYPVFNHLKSLNKELKSLVDDYMSQIDPKLLVIFDERKKYEESVNTLNDTLTKFIDSKQIEAQKMFPHYFERYKTDGVDYNMYIGQSLVRNEKYNEIYLFNLRLWQLQMMCELENIAHKQKYSLPHQLEIASLILVHSTPLAIRFRMDEKRFDVDGAYNIRYEIIKKRIDKALIKNTNERLTQPGKIAIVYNQDQEADEYLKYIKHLQIMNCLLDEVEFLEIEDLQGTSGLKALRVSVNYNKKSKEKITLDDLMNVINNDN